MKKELFVKMMTKVIATNLVNGTVDAATFASAIREVINKADNTRKGIDAAAFAEAVDASIKEAIQNASSTYAVDDPVMDALAEAKNHINTFIANRKVAINEIANAKVSYAGTYVVQAKLLYSESVEELANATKTVRFKEAKKLLEEAGISIPGVDASRCDWNNAREASSAKGDKAEDLRKALNAIRGAFEDVAAAAKGEKKVHAIVWAIKSRQMDNMDMPILRLPPKAKSLHFYINAGHGIDRNIYKMHLLNNDLLVELDDKGRVLGVTTC